VRILGGLHHQYCRTSFLVGTMSTKVTANQWHTLGLRANGLAEASRSFCIKLP
jgi:hypothetical protein